MDGTGTRTGPSGGAEARTDDAQLGVLATRLLEVRQAVRDMDATTAPHLIPPEMPQYGEDNHIFEMMQV